MTAEPAPTLEEIWRLFRETDARFKDTEARFKDTEARFRDIEAGFEDTKALVKEMTEDSRRHGREAAERAKALDEQLARLGARTDGRIRDMQATADRVSRNVDALTGKWGRFVEGLVIPAAKRLFTERGIPIDVVSERVKIWIGGVRREVNVMALGPDQAVLIEAKSTLSPADVDEHLDRISVFKKHDPLLSGRRVMGAVAGIDIVGEADLYAYRRGLFVILQSGDGVKLVNDDNFRPAEW